MGANRRGAGEQNRGYSSASSNEGSDSNSLPRCSTTWNDRRNQPREGELVHHCVACQRRMLVGTPRANWPSHHADEQRGGDFLTWPFDWLRLGLYAVKQRSRRGLRNRGKWKAGILRVPGTLGSNAWLCRHKKLYQAKSRSPKSLPC